jgi:hypothetical protein
MRMKEHLFDKRVVKRALQEGLVSKEDYQRMLDALPDLSHSLQSNTNDISVNTSADIDDLDDIDDEDDEDDIDEADDAEDAEDAEDADDDAEGSDDEVSTQGSSDAEPEQLASAEAVQAQQETHAVADDEDAESPAEPIGHPWASES